MKASKKSSDWRPRFYKVCVWTSRNATRVSRWKAKWLPPEVVFVVLKKQLTAHFGYTVRS